MNTVRFFRTLRTRVLFFVVAAVMAVVALPSHAQFNASLSGTVADSTGAVIPGAKVTLTNSGTQQVRSVTTDGSGSYRFSALAPGSYTLSTSAPNFSTSTLSNVTVVAETPRDVNVTLQLGQTSQTVEVNADTVPTLQTGDASIGSTVTSEEIQRLPLFGADPYELLRTAPGISGDGSRSGSGQAVLLPGGFGPGGSNSGIFQTENQPQISANGQRVADNDYIIDGVSANSLTHGGAAVVTPNQEAVGAITIVSSSYDASLGRNTGAQIQVVTKNGTNDLHGSAVFIYADPGFNSANKYGGPIPSAPFLINENKARTWIASLGGPIVKDKLFGFASFQEFKQKDPTFTTAYVETSQYRAAVAAMRPGGVSAAILANPGSLPRSVAVLTPNCANFGANCAIVGGGLDVGSLTTGGATQLGVFPGNNTGGGLDGVPDLQNVLVRVPAQSRGNQYNARVDWQATQKDLVAGSVYFTKLDNLNASGAAGSRPFADVPFKPLNSAGTLIYIHTFSPTWVNELRGNVTRFTDNALQDAGNTVNYGIPYVNVQDYPFPVQFGVTAANTTPANFAENTYEIRDMVTHTWGAHTIKIGYEARFEQDNDNLYGYERPTYAFDGLFAFANDASVYEAIAADPNTGGPANSQRYFRSQDYAAFVQHDWKLTPYLTFNAGLRWEEFTPLANKGSKVNYPVLGPPGSELSGMSLVPHDHLWNFQHNNFGPKVGFAYTPPMFNQKVVIRGGYSLAYNRLDVSLFNPALEDGPGIASFGLCCGNNTNNAGIQYKLGTSNSPSSYPANKALATGVNSQGFPNAVGGGSQTIEVYGALPNLKYPSTDLYSLEIERQLWSGMTTTIGYGGSTGRHFARLVNQNFLYNQNKTPVFAAYFAQTDSVLNYNALNLQLRRAPRKGVSFSLVYTYAKTLDQVSSGDGADGSANQTNPGNNASEYGPADYDAKHRVTATGLYQTPTLHTGNSIVNMLGSGFQIGGTFTWHTGYPWTPVTNTYSTVPVQNGAAVQNVVRPIAYLGGAGSSCSNSAFTSAAGSNFPKGGGAYFNVLPLPPTTVYKPGIGRNSFRSACYNDTDLTFAKEFAHDVWEHHTLFRIQANMYNAFNQLQLQPIVNGSAEATINNPFFGLAPGADEGRVIDFQARIQF